MMEKQHEILKEIVLRRLSHLVEKFGVVEINTIYVYKEVDGKSNVNPRTIFKVCFRSFTHHKKIDLSFSSIVEENCFGARLFIESKQDLKTKNIELDYYLYKTDKNKQLEYRKLNKIGFSKIDIDLATYLDFVVEIMDNELNELVFGDGWIDLPFDWSYYGR